MWLGGGWFISGPSQNREGVTCITYLLFYFYLQPLIQLGLLYYKTRGATLSALAVLKVKGVNYS